MFIGNVTMSEMWWCGNEFVWEMELIYPFGEVCVYLKLRWVHDLFWMGKVRNLLVTWFGNMYDFRFKGLRFLQEKDWSKFTHFPKYINNIPRFKTGLPYYSHILASTIMYAC